MLIVFFTFIVYNRFEYTHGSDPLKKRVKRLFRLLIIIALIWAFNNFTLKTTEQTIYSEKLSEDIKIAVISDLHGSTFGKDNKRIISKISDENPDLIFVLGDMYTNYRYEQIDTAVSLVKQLASITEVYVITGDHDTDEQYTKALNKLENVHLLAYQMENITVKGTDITIYGIDNVYFTPTFDLHNEFSEPDQSRYNILLAHIPNAEGYQNFGVDLILSGDTHGGIARLPFLGAIYYNGYFLPKLTYSDKIFDKGLYGLDNKQLYVTSGLGSYPLPLRFLNRPEICILTLKAKGEF